MDQFLLGQALQQLVMVGQNDRGNIVAASAA